MSFARILAAVDGSAIAAHALAVAFDLARDVHARVGLVHVVDPGRAASPDGGLLAAEILDERRREGAEILVRSRRGIESSAVEEFLAEGSPAEEILATARRWGADLIVIASHGRSGVARAVMGSVAERVLRQAHVPVLVVREQSGTPASTR